MTTVLLISDVRLYREGLNRLLDGAHEVEVVGVAPDIRAGILAATETKPAVIVLHVVSEDGITAVRQLAIGAPSSRIIVLAIKEEAANVIAFAEAGAAGYLALEGSLTDLISTIADVARGRAPVSPQVAHALLRHVHIAGGDHSRGHPRLTRRELEVMDLMERGFANKEIARCLGIGIPTVKNHVHAILEKIGLGSRGEAGAWARVNLADSLARLRVAAPREGALDRRI